MGESLRRAEGGAGHRSRRLQRFQQERSDGHRHRGGVGPRPDGVQREFRKYLIRSHSMRQKWFRPKLPGC